MEIFIIIIILIALWFVFKIVIPAFKMTYGNMDEIGEASKYVDANHPIVKNTVAMTGEIDLNETIHEIGGLESKIEGGKLAGAKIILYPESNQKDVDLIKEKGNIIDDSIEVRPISNIWEVLDIALEKNNLDFKNYMDN